MKDAQLGFNTNVVYQGQTLHIQTEDSGRGRPHVITHLYLGGTILATKRTSYEDCCAADDVRERVRAMMKTQHKAMLLEVRGGTHDAALRRAVEGEAIVGEAPVPDASGDAAAASSPAAPEPVPCDAAAASTASAVPPTDAREAIPPPVVHPIPTPVRARPSTSCRPPAPAPGEPDVVPKPSEEVRATPAVVRARGRRSGSIRPAVHREREGFGKDLISDRSLDEVVLSYLAEELTKDEK